MASKELSFDIKDNNRGDEAQVKKS